MININIGEVPSATYLPLSGGTMTGTLTTVAVTIGGAVAGGDQAFTNVGDMTFATGSILASGSTNGNTLLIRANDTTFITLTTGATDACTLDAITMSGTWLASGTVTFPALTFGGVVTIADTAPGIVLKARDGTQLQIRNAADTANSGITLSQANIGDIVYELNASGTFTTQNSDTATVSFKARDTGVGQVNVARIVGAADAYFEATLGVVLVGMAQPSVPVTGRLIYNSGTNKLNFYNGSAWEIVTSAT